MFSIAFGYLCSIIIPNCESSHLLDIWIPTVVLKELTNPLVTITWKDIDVPQSNVLLLGILVGAFLVHGTSLLFEDYCWFHSCLRPVIPILFDQNSTGKLQASFKSSAPSPSSNAFQVGEQETLIALRELQAASQSAQLTAEQSLKEIQHLESTRRTRLGKSCVHKSSETY